MPNGILLNFIRSESVAKNAFSIFNGVCHIPCTCRMVRRIDMRDVKNVRSRFRDGVVRFNLELCIIITYYGYTRVHILRVECRWHCRCGYRL